MRPKISVCLASYNGEKFIMEQITSILMNLSDSDEIIVSDDGSIDSTIEKIQSLEDKRIMIIYNKHPGSPARNFANAARLASGDIIFFADQDDIWAENKVELFVEMYRKRNCQYWVGIADGYLIDECGKEIGKTLFEFTGTRPGFWKNLWKNSFIGCNMACSQEFLNTCLPFPNKLPMHDWWIALLAMTYGEVQVCYAKCFFYRRHLNNYTFSSRSIVCKILDRLFMIVSVLKRLIYLNQRILNVRKS